MENKVEIIWVDKNKEEQVKFYSTETTMEAVEKFKKDFPDVVPKSMNVLANNVLAKEAKKGKKK